MFKKLTEFSYKRNWKEAVGFYLSYLLMGLILGFIAGALFGIIMPNRNLSEGLKIGVIVGAIYTLIISSIVLVQRKLYKNFGWIILTLLSVILTIFGGAILGLIIPAFMTTRGIGTESLK